MRLALIAAAALLAAGCAHGPAAQAPKIDLPEAWKLEPGWREAAPNDAQPRGDWWKRFGDAQLDALQRDAQAASPTVAAALARLDQARSQADVATAGLFPYVSLGSRVQRLQISANRPLTNYASPNFQTIQNDYQLSFNVAYEADLWGRVRSSVEAARATAEQSQADLENARLVLAADLAASYFNLRELDIELDVLRQSIALQRRALGLAKDRHDLGATSGLDVAQQQALLDSTLTQVDVLRRQRDQFEHAIATLAGKPAPTFSLPPETGPRAAPAVPLGVPADLLQRRPDIASAQRAMAAANAQIGVARAGYFPSVTIGPSFGYDSRTWSRLFDAPSTLWSIGVALTQPLFDGGRADAYVAFANAGYQLAAANYKRVVLTAMQEVQDGISGTAALDSALAQSQLAVKSAERVLQLANDRYEGGAASYSDVITAQQSLLNAQRLSAQLLGQRLLVTVQLVKALGGAW
ncbi:efflux transporter outer membrane subunit [Ramlibacter humi]|uniref:Efflux transporter outer membrane subunit n=1 Tax=Ramlibacter humi TaxID=2530451 RepID=A0A4Z0BD41_9BURK|nr:efflux transporter outer membrane subunit [Ramlibacter humi]TFY97215.1 efflux transporter outer membrane subunit [Ramlibacter humi]